MAGNIMILGTASGTGKSLLAAGLCRILKQDGYRVAPFKSQNMALNSFITPDGLEMGRAQAMQAWAAGIEPSVLMNPILLKPQSDTGSQVIVNGRVWGVMSAREYFACKQTLVPQVLEAYATLKKNCDVMVLEGAGSPAEINLNRQDMVNMGLAAMVDAPVLLAGDIDRGGVFASLYGTLMLLEREHRNRVKGLIINKFRGDVEILRPGLSQLEELTRVPVMGVVPMLAVDIEEEDSLGLREQGSAGSVLDLAVIRLPRISNFTDFHPLEQVEGVGVRYVDSARKLGSPDLILLPGTKSTMADLIWLRQNGLEAALKKAAAAGTPLMGIGGGYQMLGQGLSDPQGIEGGGQIAGMGLLPVEAVFHEQKARTRVTGKILEPQGFFAGLRGTGVEGYEIQTGTITPGEGAASLVELEDGGRDGAVLGNVMGNCLHGLFDHEEFTGALLGILLRRKGLEPSALRAVDYRAYQEEQYDLLAAALRESLDMERIYRIIEEGA